MRAQAAGISDVGLQRDHNEDCFAILSEEELFIVADGMGGHRAGDEASRLATEAILDFFEDASRGEKLLSAATAPRVAQIVASLARKESDPGRRAPTSAWGPRAYSGPWPPFPSESKQVRLF